jgi:hypothetical protein
VLGLALDHDAEREHRIDVAALGEPARRERQLVRARHPHQLDRRIVGAALPQHVGRGTDETLDMRLVEPRGHQREPAAASVVFRFDLVHAHVSPRLRFNRWPSLSRLVAR